MRRIAAALVVLLMQWAALETPAAGAVDPAVLEAQNRRIAVIETVSPSVVAIFGAAGRGGGSGVIVSADGYALTNFHVVEGAGNFMKCGLADGRLYDAVIVGVDPTGDVALIKLLGRDDFPHAALGDSDTVRIGDWVYALGNPFLLATDFQPTVTYGIASGVHRYQYPAGTFLEYTDCIQIDSSINPGNSGGPLFNEAGALIGINGRASFEKRGRVNSGAGYAVSINQIKNFLGHLKSGRIVDHATLGATVTSEADGSVRVAQVLEESEAYRRGLRVGDEIVSFAGRPIRSVNQFKNILGIYPKGWKLPLVYRHEGHKHEIAVRLPALHRKSEITPGGPRPQRPPERPGPRRPRDKQPDQQPPDKTPPDGEQPHQPVLPAFHRGPEPPEEFQHMFVAKRGYANYHFNQLEQERTLKGIRKWGDFSDVSGAWILAGNTAVGKPFEFVLTDQVLGLETGEDAFVQQLDQEPADVPPGSGGLLIALHHLRLLLTRGEAAFSEFYYLGTEPLDGRGETVDVLVSVLRGVESRWYVTQKGGEFAGFDTRLTETADPCEIRFSGSREVSAGGGTGSASGTRRLPAQLRVLHVEQEFATFHVENAELRNRSQATKANE